MAEDSEDGYDEEEMIRLREAVVDITEIKNPQETRRPSDPIKNPPETKRSSDSKDILYRRFTRMMDER